MIATLQSQGHSVRTCCLTFKVSQSGYYAARKRQRSQRQKQYLSYQQHIISTFHQHKGRYGRLRIQQELQHQGVCLSEGYIAKTLKVYGLKGRKRASFKPKTTLTSQTNIAPNILSHTSTTAPNQVTVTDITYIRTKEGFLYLSAIMDLHTRVIKGFHSGDSLETSLVLKALDNALYRYPELSGSLHHTDRGCQYTSSAYREALQTSQIKLSMSALGYCYDNAHMESFWASLKCEIGEQPISEFETKEEAKQAIFEYIEAYYNTIRLHSSIDYKTPLNFEQELMLSN